MNEDGSKKIEYILLLLASIFITYPLFVDIQEKPEIAYRALRQSAVFSVIIVFIAFQFFKKYKK